MEVSELYKPELFVPFCHNFVHNPLGHHYKIPTFEKMARNAGEKVLRKMMRNESKMCNQVCNIMFIVYSKCHEI